jgi:hypothetical protein
MLLGSMSHVFIEGGSAGEALFHVRVAVMGYSLHSPVSPSHRVVPSHSNWTLPTYKSNEITTQKTNNDIFNAVKPKISHIFYFNTNTDL